MLNIKSQLKNLGLVVALGVLSSTASATLATAPIYDTAGYAFSGTTGLGIGDWAASRFIVRQPDCSNGCDVTDASLYLFDAELYYDDTASLNGLSLSVYSDGGDGESLGEKVFSFDTSTTISDDSPSTVSFVVNSGENSFISNDTFYWLTLENVSRTNDISWGYSFDQNSADDHELFKQGTYEGNFSGEAFMFTLNGTPSVSAVPVPGAVWMMGSSLFGLLAISRRKSNKLA